MRWRSNQRKRNQPSSPTLHENGATSRQPHSPPWSSRQPGAAPVVRRCRRRSKGARRRGFLRLRTGLSLLISCKKQQNSSVESVNQCTGRVGAGPAPTRDRMMRRRELMLLLGGAMTAARSLRAQQKAAPVIGLLSVRSLGEAVGAVAAFHRGLSETGYVEGQN